MIRANTLCGISNSFTTSMKMHENASRVKFMLAFACTRRNETTNRRDIVAFIGFPDFIIANELNSMRKECETVGKKASRVSRDVGRFLLS